MRVHRSHRLSASQRERMVAVRRERASQSRLARHRQRLARLLLPVAIFVLAFGVIMVAVELHFLWRARRAVGQVTWVHRETSTELLAGRFANQRIVHTRSTATIAFVTDDGKEIRFDATGLSDGPVALFYLPSHPEAVQLDDPLSQWGGQAAVLLAGLVLLAGWRHWS